jgi:hypothetical protein
MFQQSAARHPARCNATIPSRTSAERLVKAIMFNVLAKEVSQLQPQEMIRAIGPQPEAKNPVIAVRKGFMKVVPHGFMAGVNLVQWKSLLFDQEVLFRVTNESI